MDNHPDHPAFEGIRKLFGSLDQALKNKVAHNRERAELNADFGGPYGPRPLRTGAEEQTKPEPGQIPGAVVTGRRRNKSTA